MPSGAHVTNRVTRAIIASVDQVIVVLFVTRSVVDEGKTDGGGTKDWTASCPRLCIPELRFCKEDGGGAGAFCDSELPTRNPCVGL